jgi:hypothetical protein
MSNERRPPGDWYKSVDGERIPVVHGHYTDWKKRQYFELSTTKVPSSRWKKLIQDVRDKGMVVIQKTFIGPEREHCVGYEGLFRADRVEYANNVFSFKVGEKLKDVV